MSLFGKLLGRVPFDELRQRADRSFDGGEYGEAKLEYERALSAHDAPAKQDDRQREVRERIDACCDAIADARLATAQQYLADGYSDLAHDEFTHALQTAVSEACTARIREAMGQAERDDARQLVDDVPETTLDDEFASISGTWEDEQHAEYAGYGDRFKRAMVALYDLRSAEARTELDALAAQTDDAHYLWYEVGRARLADGDNPAAMEALEKFISRIGPEEGGDSRLTAHVELAAMHTDAGDFEAAIAQYQAALEALPDDPRPYLAMGIFFRSQELAEEAVDVLNSAMTMLDDRPYFRVWQELGLAHADLGHDGLALGHLERVVEYLVARDHLDLPPETALRLAQLYEKQGNPARGLDLVQMLCEGSDVDNRHAYHLEAARLARRVGLVDEHANHLERARELGPDDDEGFAAALEAVGAAEPE